MAFLHQLIVCCCLAGAAAEKKPHILLILADDYGWANFAPHLTGDSDDAKQAKAEINTPNMDALVKEGILLDRHYTYKMCSPSRSSLQTGRLAVHVNAENYGMTIQNLEDPVSGYAGIPRNMTGMAQKLRSGGYATHAVGKWDAGMAAPEHTPEGRGYDSWLGVYQHANSYWTKGVPMEATGEMDNCLNKFTDLSLHNKTYRGGYQGKALEGKCLEDPESHLHCYEEHVLNERALEVINNHEVSEPLFLFYSFLLVHTPLEVPESYMQKVDNLVAAKGGTPIDTQNRKRYAAMTLYMDEAIGKVVDALKSRGMYEDTLIVFTSDNGGPLYETGSANNYPLKGGKYGDWEGGVRTNAFVSGGFVPEKNRGSVFNGIISIADWYATFSGLAGVDGSTDEISEKANVWLKKSKLPLLPGVDSVDQWSSIITGTNARTEPLFLSEHSLLDWPYKLIVGKQVYGAWTGPLYPNCTTVSNVEDEKGPVIRNMYIFGQKIELSKDPGVVDTLTWAEDCGPGCLYNVEEDPTEHQNLASDPEFASKLLAMQTKLKEFNETLFNPNRGVPQLAACDTFVDHGGFYGPFVDVDGFYSPSPPVSRRQQRENDQLKRRLKLVNIDFVENGLAGLANDIQPRLSKIWSVGLDVCYTADPTHDRLRIIIIIIIVAGLLMVVGVCAAKRLMTRTYDPLLDGSQQP